MDYSPKVMDLAEEIGYRFGFSLQKRLNSVVPSAMEIHRVGICGMLSDDEFVARISGLVSHIKGLTGRRL